MLLWKSLHPKFTPDALGLLGLIITTQDPRPVREQIADRYSGGWHPMNGFSMSENMELLYPGDPPLAPLCKTFVIDETVYLYDCAWLAVVQPCGSFEVCRVD